MIANSKDRFRALVIIIFFMVFISGLHESFAADILVPKDYPTIQGAIDHAASGDTVIVEDGLYKENVLIKTSVVLRSKNGSEKTFVEPLEAKNDVFKVLAVTGGVTITGFTLSGSLASGLHILKSPGAKSFNNNISGNNYGLFAEYSNGVVIKGNIFNENDTGLYLYFSNGALLEDNEVSSNTNAGILLHSSHKNTLIGNVANRNVWNGITLSSSNDNVVKGNKVLKNSYAIVLSESSGNLISDNSTMPRLYYILPVVLVYLAIMLYLIERKLFILYYQYKYGGEL